MTVTRSRRALGGIAVLACTALAGTLAPSATAAGEPNGGRETAQLHQLNNSGASGTSVVRSHKRTLDVKVNVRGLAPNLPHAQHIHYGEEARHECPTVADDTNGDLRINTAEGLPAYGPIAVSLTTRGDTSPDSALAVSRFPTAPGGTLSYQRSMTTSNEVAKAIRNGEGVVVVHGVDYNNNGEYDFESAGASELDEDLPAEATDPAVCGVLN